MTYQAAYAEQLQRNAEWRRGLAVEHPDEAERNLDAAEMSDSLAAQFTADEFDNDLMERIVALEQHEATRSDVLQATSEIISKIGFDEFPDSPDDLLDAILSRFVE